MHYVGNGPATSLVGGSIESHRSIPNSHASAFPGLTQKGPTMAEESKSSVSKASPNTPSTPQRVSGPSVPQPVDPIAGERPAAERQAEQLGSDWPKPGDEGYVHPDGTPQAANQIRANRQAAADRAAAGSAVHGAPAATPGPQIDAVAAAAVERAEADNGGEADVERRRKLTEFVREAQAVDPSTRNADEGGKRSAR